MLLRFSDSIGEMGPDIDVSELRIDGGVIWDQVEEGLVALYANGYWNHHGVLYPLLYLEGPCRMHFGLTRDPAPITDRVDEIALTGATLRTNGNAFAKYSEEYDMWQGVMRSVWWQTARIITTPAQA